MKRNYWDGIPQGRRFESFTGMQKSKELGPWVEVGSLASAYAVEYTTEQPATLEFVSGLSEISDSEQGQIALQGDTGPATSYL